jgi:hypothetical protein
MWQSSGIISRRSTLWPFTDVQRHRRMFQLIAFLWLCSAADLFLTIWAHRFTPFVEMNPLARGLLETGAIGLLVMYKTVMTLLGSSLLWLNRKHGRAELALWGIVFVHVLLAIRWSNYTDRCMRSPADAIPQIQVALR